MATSKKTSLENDTWHFDHFVIIAEHKVNGLVVLSTIEVNLENERFTVVCSHSH